MCRESCQTLGSAISQLDQPKYQVVLGSYYFRLVQNNLDLSEADLNHQKDKAQVSGILCIVGKYVQCTLTLVILVSIFLQGFDLGQLAFLERTIKQSKLIWGSL